MREQAQKVARQRIIADIVSATAISRQSQLVSLLRKNGYVVTQASVSRDLEEIGIAKVAGVYRVAESATVTVFGRLSFQNAGDHMIVARCRSGLASALAVEIDSANFDGIAGTIAGDDTVFIALSDSGALGNLSQKLTKYFDVNE
jgi:transcriptional regulator of arginine metabolism